jgi:PAS domain S-box-containing protein
MLDQKTPMEEGGFEMVTALSAVRQSVLQRATALIGGTSDLPFTEQFDALPAVSALLMTSLEELRVAEEELRDQNALLQEQRAGIDQRLRRYRQLFVHAPVPAMITDPTGTVQEANALAGKLLRRDPSLLEQKPIQALVPKDDRENFRRQFARISPEDGVTDWRLTLTRVGDVPVHVTACVQFVDGAGKSGSAALYWVLRVLDANG